MFTRGQAPRPTSGWSWGSAHLPKNNIFGHRSEVDEREVSSMEGGAKGSFIMVFSKGRGGAEGKFTYKT